MTDLEHVELAIRRSITYLNAGEVRDALEKVADHIAYIAADLRKQDEEINHTLDSQDPRETSGQ